MMATHTLAMAAMRPVTWKAPFTAKVGHLRRLHMEARYSGWGRYARGCSVHARVSYIF